MTKTLQDFLGADFVDRDTRSAAEKAASVAKGIAFCDVYGYEYEQHGNFIVINDAPGHFVEMDEGADLSRVIVNNFRINEDYEGTDLTGCPLAVLDNATISGGQLVSMNGSLQVIPGTLFIEDGIKDWTNAPRFNVELIPDFPEEYQVHIFLSSVPSGQDAAPILFRLKPAIAAQIWPQFQARVDVAAEKNVSAILDATKNFPTDSFNYILSMLPNCSPQMQYKATNAMQQVTGKDWLSHNVICIPKSKTITVDVDVPSYFSPVEVKSRRLSDGSYADDVSWKPGYYPRPGESVYNHVVSGYDGYTFKPGRQETITIDTSEYIPIPDYSGQNAARAALQSLDKCKENLKRLAENPHPWMIASTRPGATPAAQPKPTTPEA